MNPAADIQDKIHRTGEEKEMKKEETDTPLIAKMTRGNLTPEEDRAKGPKFLVHFKVEKILPLIGSGQVNL